MRQVKVAVVGAGVTGLSTAYHLLKLIPDLKVSVFEASNRVGGWIQTIPPRKEMHDCRVEVGPRTLRPSGISGLVTLKMVHELGLSSEVTSVPKSHPAAKNRFIVHDGKLNKMPSSLGGLLFQRPPVLKGLFRAILRDLTTARGTKKDESIREFVSRRFGSKMDDNLVSAIVHGIYAGDSGKLSVKSCFPRLWELEREHGSVVRGIIMSALSETPESQLVRRELEMMSAEQRQFVESTMKQAIYSFKNGMETFPQSLLKHLTSNPNFEISLQSTCSSFQSVDNGLRLGVLQSNTKRASETFDHVIFSLPAFRLHEIEGLSSDIKSLLKDYSYANVSVMTAVDKKRSYIPDGFGFLIPRSENSEAFGVVFDSKSGLTSDPNNVEKITVMAKLQPDKKSELSLAQRVLQKYIPSDDSQASPTLHCETLAKCIPHYTVGHSERLSEIRKLIDQKKISLAGASFDGVSVNDCVYSGFKTAVKVKDLLQG